jgi:hypothetical protein
MQMKRTQLAEDSQNLVVCVQGSSGSSAAARNARRRLESTRRKLIRSIVRGCQTLSDHEVSRVAEYVLVVTM